MFKGKRAESLIVRPVAQRETQPDAAPTPAPVQAEPAKPVRPRGRRPVIDIIPTGSVWKCWMGTYHVLDVFQDHEGVKVRYMVKGQVRNELRMTEWKKFRDTLQVAHAELASVDGKEAAPWTGTKSRAVPA
jgi:hypothetical protein